MIQYLVAFVSCFVLWLLLTASFAVDELVAGLLVSAFIPHLAGDRLQILSGLRLTPAAPLHLLRYLGYFLIALVRANVDVARRVLSPRLPLQPALVEVRTGLQSDLGRLLLANSITLTPGTLTVDLSEDRLLVHWIDVTPGTDLERATAAIAAGFERHIMGFVR